MAGKASKPADRDRAKDRVTSTEQAEPERNVKEERQGADLPLTTPDGPVDQAIATSVHPGSTYVEDTNPA
jgi:hypothetical protein